MPVNNPTNAEAMLYAHSTFLSRRIESLVVRLVVIRDDSDITKVMLTQRHTTPDNDFKWHLPSERMKLSDGTAYEVLDRLCSKIDPWAELFHVTETKSPGQYCINAAVWSGWTSNVPVAWDLGQEQVQWADEGVVRDGRIQMDEETRETIRQAATVARDWNNDSPKVWSPGNSGG